MGELGCHHATIPEDIIQQLSIIRVDANPPPGNDATRHVGTPSLRLARLVSVDPLAAPGWDGKLAATDVDYLADNGALLQRAIDADPTTKRGLREALDAFNENELQSKAAIEEILKQV